MSVILIGLGVLLFTVDVGKASQYAGVGSFLVGLLTASMSAVLFIRTVRSPPTEHKTSHDSPPATEGERKQRRRQGNYPTVNGDVKIFSTGDYAHNEYTEGQPPSNWRPE
ncbi:hypothetical protein OHS18_42075 [Amycolatopsis sp. NBC_00355]|uniref:hypothetical protein n=1 Tax=Amycolatopsis sp. NBC_00355 TaxID=2975957 RepID=UPI002E269719